MMPPPDPSYDRPWYERLPTPEPGRHAVLDASWFVGVSFLDAFRDGSVVRSSSRRGFFAKDVTKQQFVESIKAVGLPVVALLDADDRDSKAILGNRNGVVEIACSSASSRVEISVVTKDEGLHNKLLDVVDASINDAEAEIGTVSALVSTEHGYRIRDIGRAGVALERGNYTPEVVDDFDHIVEDLQATAPCGRLVVLSGLPGSGKSFFIRGLVAATDERCALVLVPPHLVRDLGDPSLLPALVTLREEKPGPIVLICEDGDEVLVRRGADNMSSIAAVLNLGDGLMGTMLDIRLLVTTNARKLEMDPAVERDGRLCRRLELGPLSVEQANGVIARLTSVEKACTFSEPTTLGRAYKRARQLGWKPKGAT